MDESLIRQRLASRIKRLRLATVVNGKPMTQQELGERSELAMQRIGEIERCEREVHDYERGRIARALGTTESELFADLGYTGEAVAVTGEAHVSLGASCSLEVIRGRAATEPTSSPEHA
jgi:transcriptional regulator with XRE-family HTH domain